MLTFVNVFVVGPLLAMLAIKVLAQVHKFKNLVLPKSKNDERLMLNLVAVVLELAGLCFFSMFLGGGVLVLSVPMFLIAQFIIAGEDAGDDNVKAKVARETYQRWSASFQLVGQRLLMRVQEIRKSRTSSAAQGQASQTVATSTSAPAPTSKAVAKPVVAGDRVEPVVCPRTSYSEEQLLQQLVVKVAQLQQWASRSESDREAVAELTKQARLLEEALFEAVQKLDTGTTDWKEICRHIEGLSRHQLPTELTNALDDLVKQRAGKLDDTRTDVAQLSNQLRATAGELKQKLAAPVLSPEEVISTADAALKSAEEVSSKAQQ